MQIIFDLDHTLFDTSLYKKDLFDIFLKNGASEKEVLDSYNKHLQEVDGEYSFEKHAEILKKNNKKFNRELALKDFVDFAKSDYGKYVSESVRGTLKELKKKNIEIILLTKGAENIQRQKIENSGIEKYFNEIIICQGGQIFSIRKS